MKQDAIFSQTTCDKCNQALHCEMVSRTLSYGSRLCTAHRTWHLHSLSTAVDRPDEHSAMFHNTRMVKLEERHRAQPRSGKYDTHRLASNLGTHKTQSASLALAHPIPPVKKTQKIKDSSKKLLFYDNFTFSGAALIKTYSFNMMRLSFGRNCNRAYNINNC